MKPSQPFATAFFNLQPSIFNLQFSTFNLQFSTFNFQPSTFNLQRSTFNFQPSTFRASLMAGMKSFLRDSCPSHLMKSVSDLPKALSAASFAPSP